MSGDLADAALVAAEARAARTPDSELRARGVVPTPVAIARAAMAHVDVLLRRALGIEAGLASPEVALLDPAVGTGIWLAAALEQTRARKQAPALFGIDLDEGALRATERLLAEEVAAQRGTLALTLANTLALAAPLMDDPRVRVIVGNPPWSARSLSRGAKLSDAWLAEFRREADGSPLRERRAGVLSDDYVRFLRWALEQAREAPRGALICLATNASFLDGPVHRRVRAALLEGFDRLELFDLGGNALLSRGKGSDENVFGVRVGAALTFAVREARAGTRVATVGYAALRGTRQEKLRALAAPVALHEHAPHAPWFTLVPGDPEPDAEGFSLDEAFRFHREGVQTNRDAIAIAPTRAALEARLADIVAGRLALPAARHFDPADARARLARALDAPEPPLAPLAYRPLDDRWFVTLAPLCHRPRGALIQAVAHAPLCLVGVRKERGAARFNLFGVVHGVADACYLSTRSSCRTRVFPSATPEGEDNLAPAVAAQLVALGCRANARALIAYALAVLGSPRHRHAHGGALRRDYARLPWPRSAADFARACEVGEAFIEALCGAPANTPFRVHETPDHPVAFDSRALVFDDVNGTLRADGVPLLSQVEPGWWRAEVGHHRLRDAARVVSTGTISLASLTDVVARAAAWCRAEARADALFAER
ncbi:MAG: type ISP restriction/modification enzyme [Polyangiales bacterium]